MIETILPNGVAFIGCYLNRLIYSYLKRDYRSVLDVGCGAGRQLEFFRSRGFERLAGCDIKYNLEVDHGIIEFTQLDLNDIPIVLPYKDDEFDVVLSYHVLEHIKFPGLVVREMVRVAKEIVLIIIPAGNSYESPDHIHTWETFGDVVNDLLLPIWAFSTELALSKIVDVPLQQGGFVICIYKNVIVDGGDFSNLSSGTTNFPLIVHIGDGQCNK